MDVRCTHCGTLYRIDPSRIPGGGVQARCAKCRNVFRVTADAAPVPSRPAPSDAPRAGGPPARPAAGPGSASDGAHRPARPAATAGRRPAFGPQDPDARAQRLARALVSDIVAYHPDRWEQSVRAGTLRDEFRDEILKSWEEYVTQVGADRAHGTPFFRDALNEILAKGRQVF